MGRQTKQASEQKPAGLYVIGTVSLRSKRSVPKDNPQHEVVTYLIKNKSGRDYYVDDFDPEFYYETDDYVEIPVYIKPYQNKRTGALNYSLSVQKDNVNTNRIQGEVF